MVSIGSTVDTAYGPAEVVGHNDNTVVLNLNWGAKAYLNEESLSFFAAPVVHKDGATAPIAPPATPAPAADFEFTTRSVELSDAESAVEVEMKGEPLVVEAEPELPVKKPKTAADRLKNETYLLKFRGQQEKVRRMAAIQSYYRNAELEGKENQAKIAEINARNAKRTEELNQRVQGAKIERATAVEAYLQEVKDTDLIMRKLAEELESRIKVETQNLKEKEAEAKKKRLAAVASWKKKGAKILK